MKRKLYQIIAIPIGTTGKTKTFIVRTSRIRVLIYILVGLFLIFSGITAHYIYIMSNIKGSIGVNIDPNYVNNIIPNQKRIDSLENRLFELEEYVDRIEDLSSRIKIIADISDPHKSLINYGLLLNKKRQDTNIPSDKMELAELKLALFHKEAIQYQKELSAFKDTLIKKKGFLSSIPSLWPVKGSLSGGFGFSEDSATGKTKMHTGIDISTSTGSSVISPSDGIIEFCDVYGGYGNLIVVNHGNNIKTWHGHLNNFRVKLNDKIRRGQIIGTVGMTGRTTGPHLHYEIRIYGIPVNPLKYILEDL